MLSSQRTPVSLLERVRQPSDHEAWQRLVQLYTPLLFYWARFIGLQAQDAADLVQDVFVVLVEKLPEFAYDRQRSFRGWLRTVLLNQWRGRLRRRSIPVHAGLYAAEEECTVPDGADLFGEAEYQRYMAHRALELMQAEFQFTTWKACWEHVVMDRPAPEVAAELGLTVNAVYIAKSRVLRRLREELAGLLEE